MFGAGILIVDADHDGDPPTATLHSGADTCAPCVAPPVPGKILSTGRASSFSKASGGVTHRSLACTDPQGEADVTQLKETAHGMMFDAWSGSMAKGRS